MLLHLLPACFSDFGAILLLKACSLWGFCDIVLYQFSAFLPFIVVCLYFWRFIRVQQGPDLLAHLLQSQVLHPFSYLGLRNFRCALQIQTSDGKNTFNFLSDFIYRIAVILNSGWLNWCLFFILCETLPSSCYLWLSPPTSHLDFGLFILIKLVQKLSVFCHQHFFSHCLLFQQF